MDSGGAYPAHFDGRRFFNPGAPQTRGFPDVLRWKFTSRPEKNPGFRNDVQPSTPPARVAGPEIRSTFVNHSTVLLQTCGLNLLTDPIWSKRASPFQWAGPARQRDPGVRWEDLPRIDIVLLSHNHYDHLDIGTLRRLKARGDTPKFVAPLGVGEWIRRKGFGEAHELDWGQSAQVGQVRVHGTQAQHFSARGILDRNRTLWCGYWIEIGGRSIYFAGDTAFGDHFARIRERHGAPDLALLPIGAYEPRWFMAAVHMGPEDALRTHAILGARRSLAIHFGTFQLADEGIDTPAATLRPLLRDGSFSILRNGEAMTV